MQKKYSSESSWIIAIQNFAEKKKFSAQLYSLGSVSYSGKQTDIGNKTELDRKLKDIYRIRFLYQQNLLSKTLGVILCPLHIFLK